MPEHHVSTLYMLKKKDAFVHHHAGRLRVVDIELPAPKKKPSATSKIQWRQQESLQRAERIVERESLAAELDALVYPIAMLDFETVQLAVPVWPGCTPQAQIPVQFSCHVLAYPGAEPVHYQWIARGSDDPRPRIVEALVVACQDAATVMAYFSSFEKGCLARLAEWVPARARGADVDPRPDRRPAADRAGSRVRSRVRRLVLHQEGASRARADDVVRRTRHLQGGSRRGGALSDHVLRMTDSEREYVSDGLLEYCKRDTEAMVELHRSLQRMAR